MQTNVNKVSDVEYELEIRATAEDLLPDLDRAIREQRGKTTMKGFRPGRVPISLVKKVYGKTIAYGVAENTVQKTYESEIVEAPEYEVLGQPTITDLDYEYEGDLRAVVRFGVRPEFELGDFSGTTVLRLHNDVEDADVEKEIQAMLAGRAELIPDEGPVTEESVATVDMQKLDPETGVPVVGGKQEGISVFMGDENVLPQLKDALAGKKESDSFRVSFPGPAEGDPEQPYEVSVVAVKRREMPELDDALVSEITSERISSVDDFRDDVRRQLAEGWDRRSKELFEADLVSKSVALHDFTIPESVVDMYLDAYVREVKEQSGGDLPPQFDENAYREQRKEEAIRHARWMFVRDRIIAEASLVVGEDDRDGYFETMTGEGLDVESLKGYYRGVPGMLDQLNQRLLSDKVFDWISERVSVEEKDLEAYREASKSADADD